MEKSILKMEDLMPHINQIKQRQDLISEQFKKFGEGIDINSKRLDDVDATLKYFRYHHADKYIMENGMAKLDKEMNAFNNMIEEVRLELQATDKYL